MKKKRIAAMSLAASMAFCLPAYALDTTATVHGRVYTEGQPITCLNVNQQRVPILAYNNSIYIPIRTAGEWMGKKVEWNGETKTVVLSGQQKQVFYNEYDEGDKASSIPADTKSVSIASRPDITVTVDGQKKAFQNVKGEPVYPIAYNGTTYLPLRSIGELTGMEVLWVAPSAATGNADYTYLRTPVTDAQKTEISDYTKQQNDLLKQLAPALKNLSAQTNTKENLETVKTTLKKMAEMKTPSAKVADFYSQRYQAVLKDVQTSADKITEKTTDSDLDILTRTMRYNCITAEDYLHTLAAIGEQSGLSTLEKIDFEPEAGQGPTQEELAQWENELKNSLVNGDYPRNSKGETYGSERLARFVGHKPDLIAVVGEDMKGNEKAGYIRDSDVPFPEVKTPEDAQKYMEYLRSLPAEIEYPLYDSEGNVIGKFFSHNPTAD